MQCHNVGMLQCHNVGMLQCHNVGKLQCHKMLKCCNVTMSRKVAMFQCIVAMQVQRVVEGSCGLDGGQVLATAQVISSFLFGFLSCLILTPNTSLLGRRRLANNLIVSSSLFATRLNFIKVVKAGRESSSSQSPSLERI